MLRNIAFVIAIAAFVYTDLDADSALMRSGLPLVGVLCLFYVFGVVGAGLLGASGLCFYFTDVISDSLFESLVLPLLFMLFLLAFLFWAWTAGYLRGGPAGADGGSGGFGDFGGGGGE